jgi:lipopolysaccharide transport system ATP-binding protein
MSTVVIHGEGLGKSYHRGALQQSTLLRDHLSRMLKSPLSVFRHPKDETFWALKDVSLEVRDGEVVGLIGPNGAGKTTLLKILSRITKPTTGWAEIHGRVRSLLEVGTGFHPELTGRENTFLSGAILGMGKSEITRKFDEIVAFAELEEFIDTPVKHYSSGMYVRLAFAVAAHLEPEILLVDEVLAVGDASFQKKCIGKMGDVARRGRTIIFVSHNMTALRKLCSRAILMDHGQITSTGDSDDVVNQYLQRHMGTNLETVWDDPRTAPGDHRVRLRSVRVIPEAESDDPITVHTPVRIQFSYWNYVPDTVLNISMVLNNAEETCVFASPSDFSPRPAGLIRHTVTIPGDLLNTGSYYVNLFVVKDASASILFQSNVVGFEVVEGEIVGHWYGKFPGTTRPKLQWETEAIESEGSSVVMSAVWKDA